MKIKSFPKTHYERVFEAFNSKIDFHVFLEAMSEKLGEDTSYMAFGQAMMSLNWFDKTSERDIASTINILFHIFQVYHSHEKFYYVTPQLAAKLAQTDLNVDTHFIHSPFKEIHIQINPGLFSIQEPEGLFPVRGFYVYLNEDKTTHIKEVRIAVAALLPSTKEIPFNDTFFYFKLFLEPGKIKDVVKKILKENTETNRADFEKFGGAANLDHLEEFTYFVLNTLLYITSKDPDIRAQFPMNFGARIENKKSRGKIQKLQKMAARSTAQTVMVVGESFLDVRKDFEDIRDAGGVGKWKLLKRVYVSGHWKIQWYGAREAQESKHIFIEPYYKGPELAEVLHQKYQVGVV